MLFPTKCLKKKFCCWTVSVVLKLKLNLSQMQYISEISKISICWGWSGEGGGPWWLPPPPFQPHHILLKKVMIRMKTFFFSLVHKILKILFQMLFPTKCLKIKICRWTVSVVLMLRLNLSQMQYISESSKISICWGWSGEGGGPWWLPPPPFQPHHILLKKVMIRMKTFFFSLVHQILKILFRMLFPTKCSKI